MVPIETRDRRRFRKLLEETKTFEGIPIRTRLTEEEVARFVGQRYRFPGVEVQARLFRQYPLGESAAHVIGYIGRVSEKDLDRLEEREEQEGVDLLTNYQGTDYIGKEGLEKKYEPQLHGTTGAEEVEVTASGRAVQDTVAHAGAVGRQPRAVDRHQAAAAGRGGVRRPARRAGRDRAVDRRHPRVRVAAELRPEPVRRRHRRRELEGAQRIDRQAADQPAARPAPIRRDRRSSPTSRWPRSRTASARRARRSSTPATSTSATIASATTRKAATAPSTCTSRSSRRATPTTTCSRPTCRSTRSRTSSSRSASGRSPASTSKASGAACCRRPSGSGARSRRPSSSAGSPATRSRSASGRATTRTRRCSSRTPWRRSPTTAS